MTEVTIGDIAAALRRLGVQPGDTVMYHGSMKSLGHVAGGAPAVIDGVLASAPEVTAAMPTLWYDGHPERFREADFDPKDSPGTEPWPKPCAGTPVRPAAGTGPIR